MVRFLAHPVHVMKLLIQSEMAFYSTSSACYIFSRFLLFKAKANLSWKILQAKPWPQGQQNWNNVTHVNKIFVTQNSKSIR